MTSAALPTFAVVHVYNPYGCNIRLWAPLFLLWIPVFLLSPFLLMLLFAVRLAHGVPLGRSIAVAWGILTSLSGTEVHVQGQANHVLVKIL